MPASEIHHPPISTIDVFIPTRRANAARYLRDFADMLDQGGPPYNAAIENIAIELQSERDSRTAEVTIRMIMKNDPDATHHT